VALVGGAVCVGRVCLSTRRVCPLNGNGATAMESAMAMSAALLRLLTDFKRFTGRITVSFCSPVGL
jgi:hypothetical protein